MALVIEDGTIVANANSYQSVANLDAWATEMGDTLPATTAEKETLLFKAMEAMVGRNWKGDRVGSTQVLDWPRHNVYVDGQLLSHQSIPRHLEQGQLQLALAANRTTLQPTTAANAKGPIIEERAEGAVTVKYANTGKVMPVAAAADAETHLNELTRNSGLLVVRV